MKIVLSACLAVAGCITEPNLSIEKTGEGRGRVRSDSDAIDCGDRCGMLASGPVTLTGSATADSVFVGWSGGGCEGTDPCTVMPTVDTTVTAQFEPFRPELTVVRSDGGTVEATGITCGEDCTESYAYGANVVLVATAAPGYALVRWSREECGGALECTVTMTEAQTIEATFSPYVPLTITVAGDGVGIIGSQPDYSTCGTTCTTGYVHGTVVTLTAVADPISSVFSGWSGACSGTAPTCTITMDGARTVIATFTRPGQPPAPCTTTVTTDEHAMLFNTRLTSGAVVCIANGVTITGPVLLQGDYVTIRAANPGDLARIINTNGNAIDLGGHHDITLRDLDVEARGPDLIAALTSTVLTTTATALVTSSKLRCESHNCYIVKATNNAAITIKSSELSGGVQIQDYSYGVYGYYGATIQIDDTTITSYGMVLADTPYSSFTVTSSELTSLHPYAAGNNAAIMVYNVGAYLYLRGSTVRTAGFAAISTGGDAGGVRLALEGNTFRKIAGTTAGNYSPIQNTRSDTIIDSMTPNTFCNEGTSTTDGQFVAPFVTGALAAASTWNPSSQIGVSNCP